MLILQRVTQSEADCSDERQAGQIDEEQDSVIGCHMLYEPFEFDFMNIMKNIFVKWPLKVPGGQNPNRRKNL